MTGLATADLALTADKALTASGVDAAGQTAP